VAVVLSLLIGAVIDEGGTLEELGWRGFALPQLIDRMASPLTATVLLGVLWWAWHLPREITTLMGGAELPEFFLGQTKFLILCLALSVVITYVFLRTGGSVWAGILIHGGTNVWSKALGAPANRLAGEDVRTIIVAVIAILILIATGGRLGRRQRPWIESTPRSTRSRTGSGAEDERE
jgi:membrane protease YdiL (CAAX protease family)